MKTKPMFVALLIAIVAIVAFFVIRGYFRSEGYFLAKLPQKYKAYPSLHEEIETENFKVIALFTGARPKQIYKDTVNDVLIIEKMEEFKAKSDNQNNILLSTFYRLDKNGKLLGRITTRSDEEFGFEHAGFILYENDYSTFLRNGQTIKIPYKIVNKDLSMSKDALTKLLSQLRENSEALKVDYESELKIYTAFVNNEVQKIYTLNDMDVAVEHKFQTNFLLLPKVNEYVDGTFYQWDNKNAPIYVDYFLKQHYNPASSSSPFSPAPMSRPENWEGMGYLHIPLG
ncbi:MAG: hypothetical protein EOO96_24375, partial [Pedobacter sp.]